jgi:hypothetical protein
MNLEEMEAYLLERLDYVGKSERASAEDLLRCMEVLAQVRQAEALDSLNHWVQLISHRLDDMHIDG